MAILTTMDYSSELNQSIPSLYTYKIVGPVTITTVTNDTLATTTANCFIHGDILIYNGTEFIERPTPLTYLDQIFWMYLIMYVVLTIFAGTVILSHYVPIILTNHTKF